jgi:hypothetical protein
MRIAFNLIAVLALGLLASCAGGASLPEAHAARLATPVMAPLGGKMASGLPEGIFVTWTRNSEPEAAGYFLYRDVNPIPTPPPDELMNPALRVNGGNLISQPPSGPSVSFTDIFSVTVGETYYYRVTVVDNEGTESFPSNEMDWTVLGQTVTGLSPTQAFWGEDVTLTGDTFGVYNPVTDHVLFQAAGGNTVEGAVVSWDDTEIVATVPDDAITGPVYVVIDATIAATDDDLEILNPFITQISPEIGFVEQLLTISGANFGGVPDEVWIGATDVTSSVQTWSDTQIELLPPDGIVEAPVTVVVGSLTSNGITFKPRAEILFLSRDNAQPGAEITIAGRYFGAAQGTVTMGGQDEPVVSWTNNNVAFTATRSAGTYQLSLTDAAGSISNSMQFTMLDPLMISISGIDPGEIYTVASAPTVSLNLPPDAVAVSIWADGKEIHDWTLSQAPTEVVLAVSSIPNGTRSVWATAGGRGVAVQSNTLIGTFYSLPGDISGDGLVNELDLNSLLSLIGLTESDSLFRPWFDADADGIVTEADASAVGYFYGNAVTGGLPGPG